MKKVYVEPMIIDTDPERWSYGEIHLTRIKPKERYKWLVEHIESFLKLDKSFSDDYEEE